MRPNVLISCLFMLLPAAGAESFLLPIASAEPVEDRNWEMDILYHIGDTRQEFHGFGAQIWGYYSNPDALELLFDGLNIQYVRIENFRESASWSQMQSTRALTDARGIQWLYMVWSAPYSYVYGGMLRDNKVGDFALWWANHVSQLNSYGLRPHYIELMNEPDSGGQWSTGISESNYNLLAQYTRTQLDNSGFADVGIVGPGVSHLNWDHHASNYIGALDANGVNAIAAWSTHAWDDGDICGDDWTGGWSCLSTTWPDYLGAILAKDPELTRPVWITEYATKEDTFHGVYHPRPDENGGYNTTNTIAFAARVYENTLSHFASGANAIFLWQGIDEPTEVYDKDKAWGLIDLNGDPKPVFGALETLCPKIPVGARVLPAASQAGKIFSAAFLDDDQLIVGMSNDWMAPQSATLQVSGVKNLTIESIEGYELDQAGDPANLIPDTGKSYVPSLQVNNSNTVDVSIPADGVLTIVFSVEYYPGDFDRNGDVSLEDYSVFVDCFTGTGVEPVSACSNADIDGDQDVDLQDFAAFQENYGVE